jgi:predicted dehydrogenase
MTWPRLGFIGLGWIGRHRLKAIVDSGAAAVVALADQSASSVEAAAAMAPMATRCDGIEPLLECDIDGVIIATPSALHAAQTIACLERGRAVFCQKPLARSQIEAAAVIAAARAADRRLGVDLCYRETTASRAIRQMICGGELGHVYAVNLAFHNAYGPDKDWYYERSLSGGGCVMDLGIHLIDQLLWQLDWDDIRIADSHLFSSGRAWRAGDRSVEDFAHVILEGPEGAIARLTCSWRAPAGRDAEILVELYGTRGGARFANVGGSFYEFTAEHLNGTSATLRAAPPDDWSGRAVVAWARALAEDGAYTPEAEQHLRLAGIIDEIYAAADRSAAPVASAAERA